MCYLFGHYGIKFLPIQPLVYSFFTLKMWKVSIDMIGHL